MSSRPARLLTVGHSYVVALNRRLPQEIARVSQGRWQVTAVAPRFVHAQLRDIRLERDGSESCDLAAVNAYATRYLHAMAFGTDLREILRRGWDLVHIYQEPYIFAGWQTAYWTPSEVPVVFFTAQNYVKHYPPPFAWMERYCIKRCAGWISCGELVSRALLQKDYGRRPHRRIGFGVDTELFRPDPERRKATRLKLGWDDAVPVVTFLGVLNAQKGVDVLMSALDRVQASWRALFIGSGPMRPKVEQWAARYPDRTRILALDHSEVPGYLNAADILCAPSQTQPRASEQFGRVLIEAFASGLAVIGSDSGEIPYVIGDAGIVAGEKDLDAWSRALERLLVDEDCRMELSQRARCRAAEQFAWPVIARQHIDFFSEIIEE